MIQPDCLQLVVADDLQEALPPPLAKSILDLQRAEQDDQNTLLGHRFLCRGSGILFVGSTGIGKSTAVLQACISWAVGRSCFGIKPARALKMLIVQAENDEAEICEMRDGITSELNLNDEERDAERKLLGENLHIAFEDTRTGQRLFDEAVEPLLQSQKPDLLVLDPALSYIGGDANKQDVVGPFLRNLLTPALRRYNCGGIVVHHTAKPNANRDAGNRVAHDFAYLGTGSSEWANWARGVLVLTAKDNVGLRELLAPKRGSRLGWTDEHGMCAISRLIQQNYGGGSLFYREITPENAAILTRTADPTKIVLADPLILPSSGGEISKDELLARITSESRRGGKICGIQHARWHVVPFLVKQGYLEEFDQKRTNARPQKWLRRTDKTSDKTG
jgi:hypothetical protein